MLTGFSIQMELKFNQNNDFVDQGGSFLQHA